MDQNLFKKNIPEGFLYYPDFISEQEENDLLNTISRIHLQTLVFQGYIAKRKVKSFGYHYDFDSRKISKGIPIPEDFFPLIEKVGNASAIVKRVIKEK